VALIPGTTAATEVAGATIASKTYYSSGVAGATNIPPAATTTSSVPLQANGAEKMGSGFAGLFAAGLVAVLAL
jgi:hypothetical protein